MKILILNSLYYPHLRGGAERSVQVLAEALMQQGVEVVVASTDDSEATTTAVVNGVKVVYLPIANLYWPFDERSRSPLQRKLWHFVDAYNLAMRAEITRLIHQEQPHVIHTNNLQGMSVAAWHAGRAARIPILHTLRDYYLTCARCSRYRNGCNCKRTCWNCLPFLLARRQASGCVVGVVGNSRFILDRHRQLGFFENTSFSTVIHNACPPIRLTSLTRTTASPYTFGYLGRLAPSKGIELLLDVLESHRNTGWTLLVAGEGDEDYQQELQRRYAGLEKRGTLQFLGWTDPAEFFARVDLLIVPSLWQEPLPRVILEAYSYGVPVIGSRRGGIPELIEDGETGLLFDPDDSRTLGTIIDRLLPDRALCARLGHNALRRAQEHSAERVASKYQEAYRAMLDSVRR